MTFEQFFRDLFKENIFKTTFSSVHYLFRENTIQICQFHAFYLFINFILSRYKLVKVDLSKSTPAFFLLSE